MTVSSGKRIAETNDPETKPNRLRELRALVAVMQHVGQNPAEYAEPRPVAKAFTSINGMPPRYDVGALIYELVKLKLFVVEMRDFVATLVPAESGSPKPETTGAKRVTVAGKVLPEIDERLRAFAASRRETVSSVIAAAITEYLQTH
jgi:hypothetical protein